MEEKKKDSLDHLNQLVGYLGDRLWGRIAIVIFALWFFGGAPVGGTLAMSAGNMWLLALALLPAGIGVMGIIVAPIYDIILIHNV